MAGITKYERMRRQYGEGAIAMIHHAYNKWSNYAFHSDLTMQTMEEFLEALGDGMKGGASNYVPIRTYYIPLKEFPAEWEKVQYHLAQIERPQDQKLRDLL